MTTINKITILLSALLFVISGCGNTKPTVEELPELPTEHFLSIPWESEFLPDGAFNPGDQYCFKFVDADEEFMHFDLNKCD